jgi:hypothetical protein
LGVAADADDATILAALTKALQSGTLKAKDFAVMSEEPAVDDDPRKELANIVTQAVIAGVKAAMPVTAVPAAVAAPAAVAVAAVAADDTATEMEKAIDARVNKQLAKMTKAHGMHTPAFANGVMGGVGLAEPRVKSAVERYNKSRTAATYPMKTEKGGIHPMGGRQAMIGTRPLEVPSPCDKAVIGATMKWKLWEQTHDPLYRLTEHDVDLVQYALAEEKWNGPIGIKGGDSADMRCDHYLEGMKLTKDTEYALVNDVATGGAFATPEIWDDAVVLNAVLYGELFPFVETTNLPRGAFVHGVQLLTDPVISPAIGTGVTGNQTQTQTDNFYDYGKDGINPSGYVAPGVSQSTNAQTGAVTYPGATTQVIGGITVYVPAYGKPGIGQAYNQPILEGNQGLYQSANLYADPSPTVTPGTLVGSLTGVNYLQSMAGVIGNFDIGIFPVVAAMQIGLDFESDAPVAWGNLLVDRTGIQMQAWLDNAIANGTGAGQPLGLFNCGGAVVTPTNSGFGSVGPIVKADLEKLLFGISKAMRASKGGKNFYVMNDQQYRLCRSIPWLAGAAATAQARVYGADLEEYKLEGHDVKIQINIASGAMAFANLAYYRMIRRLGMSIRQSTEGLNLMLQNTRLIIGRARWGGRLTKPDAIAIMSGAEYADHGYPASSYGPAYSGGGTYSP